MSMTPVPVCWQTTVTAENKKECALAHSRAEARLPRQPSTLAPGAHPRGAFIIVWKQSFLYDNKA